MSEKDDTHCHICGENSAMTCCICKKPACGIHYLAIRIVSYVRDVGSWRQVCKSCLTASLCDIIKNSGKKGICDIIDKAEEEVIKKLLMEAKENS